MTSLEGFTLIPSKDPLSKQLGSQNKRECFNIFKAEKEILTLNKDKLGLPWISNNRLNKLTNLVAKA